MQLNSIRTVLRPIAKLVTLCVLSLGSLTPMITFAQDGPPVFLCPGGGVDCLIAGYGVSQQGTWMLQPAPDQSQSMAVGSVLNTILDMPGQTARPMLIQQIINTLTTVDPKSTHATIITQLPSILVAPSICQQNNTATGCTGNPVADAQAGAAHYNLNSLLSPVAYGVGNNPVPAQAAQNFITLASGIGDPFQVLDFSTIKLPQNATLTSIQSLPDVAKYLVMLRTYTAQQTVGLGNLYQLYAERLPQKGLGQQAAMPNATADTSESPLQVEQFMATRQISDPSWFTHMQNASPAAVSRATLFTLAEIPAMLYQIHLDLERLTATMSVLELQQTSSNRIFMEQARGAAESAISAAANPPATPAQ